MTLRKYYGERLYGSSEGGAPRLSGYDVYLAQDVDELCARLKALAARTIAETSPRSHLRALAEAFQRELYVEATREETVKP